MSTKTLQILCVCLAAALLLSLLAYTLYDSYLSKLDIPEVTTETTEATTEATTLPTETSVPTEPSTEPPQPEEFVLTFAGDCTLANIQGRTGSSTFVGTVGENYAYPFANVQTYFAEDDCTFVNLECVLSERGYPADKMFTFRGPSTYINILTEGSVEYAGVVNNHTMDYGKDAYNDTLALLDGAGIAYAEDKDTVLFTTESGLTIGVYSHNFPTSTSGIGTKIQSLRDQGAEVVVMCVHWGNEYYFKPTSGQVNIGRYAIDHGADIVFGHHPHVLQPIEEYNGGVIFYSLGNFSFGGNGNPADLDTAVLQQTIIRDPDGTIHMGERNIVPCYITSNPKNGNNYQPTPMDPELDAEAYQRVLRKLNGTYEKDKLYVSYRDDLNGGGESSTTPTGGNSTTPTGGNAGGATEGGSGGENTGSGDSGSGGEAPAPGGSGGETPPPAGGSDGGGDSGGDGGATE